jgi:hypothetical protein
VIIYSVVLTYALFCGIVISNPNPYKELNMLFAQVARLSIWTLIGNVVNWLSFTVEAWMKVQYSGTVRIFQRWSDTLENILTDSTPDRIAVWIENINLERLMITLIVIILIVSVWYALKTTWKGVMPRRSTKVA